MIRCFAQSWTLDEFSARINYALLILCILCNGSGSCSTARNWCMLSIERTVNRCPGSIAKRLVRSIRKDFGQAGAAHYAKTHFVGVGRGYVTRSAQSGA